MIVFPRFQDIGFAVVEVVLYVIHVLVKVHLLVQGAVPFLVDGCFSVVVVMDRVVGLGCEQKHKPHQAGGSEEGNEVSLVEAEDSLWPIVVGDVEFSEYNGSYEIELEIILNSLLRRGGQYLKILVGYAIEILPVLVLVDLRLLLLE